MLHHTFAQLRANAGRVAASAVAIVLGVAFVAATLVFTSTLQTSMARALAAPELAADLVATSRTAQLTRAEADRIAEVDGVAAAQVRYTGSAEALWAGGNGYAPVFPVAAEPQLHWFDLADGHLPRPDGHQVALDAAAAEDAGVGVGDALTVKTPQHVARLTVSGLVDTGRSVLAGGSTPALFLPPPVMQQLGLTSATAVDVVLAPGADPDAVRQAITHALPQLQVHTGQERADQAVEQLGPVKTMLNAVLLPFAGIALFVAGFVIVNTFAVLLAQRARQYALLRCVGATRGQIRGSALLEALIVAAVASLVGTAVGIAVAAVASWVLGLTSGPLQLSALGIGVPAVTVPPLVGIVVTVLAALLPVQRATRVSPLAALRPVQALPAAKRIGRIRLALAVVLTATGAVLLGVAASVGEVKLAVPAAAVGALGVLLWTPSLVPLTARAFGVVLRFPTGHLAAGNAVRNPGRAATTSTALMIGVGLIVMLASGTATAQQTARTAIEQRYPVDATLVSQHGGLSPGVQQQARRLDGVEQAVAVPAAQVTVDGQPWQALGVPREEFARVVRHDPHALRDGVALVHPDVLGAQPPAARWHVVGPDGSVDVAVRASKLVEPGQLVVTSGDLARIAAETPVAALWLRIDPQVSAKEFVDDLKSLYLRPDAGVFELGGSAPIRVQVDAGLEIMLSVVLGLLGVAVVIATVGIANTLGLSVLERMRESALLRALGLTRGQLRGMLAVEAVLLAVVGAALGTALGVVFAWGGSTALFKDTGFEPVFTVPVGVVGAVFAAAVAAGVAASVLPARRAMRGTLAQQLADE